MAALRRLSTVHVRLGALLGVTVLAAGSVLLFGASADAQTGKGRTVVVTEHNATWGTILALSNGHTVYRFAKDPKNRSTCSGPCANVWPPVLLATGQKRPAGRGVSHLGTIKRGNRRQVTYEGIPLYLYIGDGHPHAVTGNITDTFGPWWVVNPVHPLAVPTPSTRSTSSAGTSAGGGTSTTSGHSGGANNHKGGQSSSTTNAGSDTTGTATGSSGQNTSGQNSGGGSTGGSGSATPGSTSPEPTTPPNTAPPSTTQPSTGPQTTNPPQPSPTTTAPKPTPTTTAPPSGGVSY
ncbi:MAG TPA: hypothetical protein VE991_05215 [Acidimicrobiales bacterium]|nr:hypothetical protein [Acidimicrobiales bacterium]